MMKGASRLPSREGFLCVAALVACLLLIWPIAEIGINDDWAFTLTTLDLARTGHFIFHGWAAPMLGWQALWGALFAKLFGAGFTAVRLSMIPIAAAALLVYRAVLRGFGLNPAHATFGTLVLGIGPLFLPLSATFMTDVPCLFAILVCVYLCQRALAAPSSARAIGWLAAAVAANLALGTVRQIAWLGLLVIVPSCAWLLRRQRYVVPAVVVFCCLGAVCVRQLSHWFAAQPYTAPEVLTPALFTPDTLLAILLWTPRSILEIGLLCLPLLILGVSAIRRPTRRQAWRMGLLFGAFVVGIAIFHAAGKTHFIEPPWLGIVGNNIGVTGFMQGGGVLFGSTRAVPDTIRLAVFTVFVVAVIAFAEALAAFRRSDVSTAEQNPVAERRSIYVLLGPFLIVYCLVFLASLAIVKTPFDRYFLEVIAVLIVFILHWHQTRVSARVPALAKAMLLLFAGVSVGGMHDLFAMDRAEVRAADQLQRAGIPRTQIRGGFSFDATTQVYAWGYLNDPRLLNPPGAYHPQPLPDPMYRDGWYCGYPFLPYVPALHIRYVISPDPTPCLGATAFAPETYVTWLPPARRELFIGRVLPADGRGPHP